MDNQVLAERLKVVLATSFAFALKAQNYHWNVKGPHFVEYHDFLQEIYETVYGDADDYAEQIRFIGMYAPGSFSRFSEMSRIEGEMNIPNARQMFAKLKDDNKILLELLNQLHGVASHLKNVGVSSLIEDKIQYHDKLGWKLSSLVQVTVDI